MQPSSYGTHATPDDTGGLARLVADNAPSTLVYLDADLRIRFANRHCYELFGRTPREVLGRPLADLLDPRTLRYALAHRAEVERGNLAPRDYVLSDREGDRKFVKVHAVPNRDRSGRSVGYFACTSDNAAERVTRAALSAAEERLSFALAACEAGIWVWDLAAHTAHYTAEFKALLGYGEGEFPPDFGFFGALHAEDGAAMFDAVAAAIQDGGVFDREFRIRCADGGYRWLRCIGRAIVDPATGSTVRLAGTVRDISPRKQVESRLREAQALVQATLEGQLAAAEQQGERERLDQVKRELVAAAGHELRTPLASIIAALELLCEGKALGTERAAESFLRLALRNAERLARVVEQWLDVERIDLGVTRVQAVALDLGALVARVIAERAAAAQRHSLRFETGGGLGSVLIRGDAERLRQAVAHLISGAIDRSPPGAVVSVRIEVHGDKATLHVEDEGPELFSGADLGLSLSKAIVERLGGTLGCTGRQGKGAAYQLALPRLAAAN
ncbi:MAG TPA: PAS domain-containing protein [Burkholderiales bacterium]|nr:PAS domain-containing protein [Burkholderiales bacterium]